MRHGYLTVVRLSRSPTERCVACDLSRPTLAQSALGLRTAVLAPEQPLDTD